MTAKTKSIYQKLADARYAFHRMELKKTGLNKYAGYKYFELGDFLVQATECLRDEGLVAFSSFDQDTAYLHVHETDGGEGYFSITSPMREANLKGCHPIQNLGAVETYQIRYLMVALMAICEHDALDSSEPISNKTEATPAPAKKKVAKKKAAKTPEPETDDFNEDGINIPDDESAILAANFMINLAKNMHATSVGALADFWKKNKETLDLLSADFPNEFSRVKSAFTTLRKKVQE